MSNGNGGAAMHESPCEDLEMVRVDMRRQEASLATARANLSQTQQQVGEMLLGIGEAAEHAKNASRDAAAARRAAEKVEAKIFAGVNELVAKYDSNPPELLDADDGQDIPTSTAIQVPHLSERKIRREQRKTAEAEQARIRLEAEKLVAERHAQDLADAKARDDKRHARNLALLAALAAVATMTAAALALLGKFMQ